MHAHSSHTYHVQIHIGVVTVVDHNLFVLACLATFSLNASRIYIGLGHFLEHWNMWFVVKILTFTSARWQTSFILDLTWHTDSCTSLLQRPPRSVDVASCTDPGQLKILHRSRASSSPCYHRLSPISPKHFSCLLTATQPTPWLRTTRLSLLSWFSRWQGRVAQAAPSLREGALAWQPGLLRLPGRSFPNRPANQREVVARARVAVVLLTPFVSRRAVGWVVNHLCHLASQSPLILHPHLPPRLLPAPCQSHAIRPHHRCHMQAMTYSPPLLLLLCLRLLPGLHSDPSAISLHLNLHSKNEGGKFPPNMVWLHWRKNATLFGVLVHLLYRWASPTYTSGTGPLEMVGQHHCIWWGSIKLLLTLFKFKTIF